MIAAFGKNLKESTVGKLRYFIFSAAGLVIVAIALAYAYWTAFSYFSVYDDEGWGLIGVRGFLEGHSLYSDIFSFYGPFYYCYEWMVHSVLAIPLTHDATTALCVAHWLIGSAILAVAGYLLSRSLLIAGLVFMQMALHLTPLAREPGHPQEVAVLLLCAAAMVAAGGRRPRDRLWMLVAIGVALIFTKINIGVFYGCALLLALASGSSFFESASKRYFLILVLSALLPFVLMRPNMNEAWALAFACQSCVTILTAGTVAWFFAEKEDTRRSQLLPAAVCLVGLSAALILMVVLKGTPFLAMVHALVTQPARLGSSFSIPLKVPGSIFAAGLAAFCALAIIRSRAQGPSWRLGVACAKATFGVIGIFLMVTDYNRELGYLLPWSWLLLIPNEPGRESARFGRVFICLTAVWQGLQAYPVAGTQAVVGTLFLPLIYGICLLDGIKSLSVEAPFSRLQLHMKHRSRTAVGILAFTALLCVFADQWCNPFAAWRYYNSVPPLGLNGSQRLHLPVEQRESYRALTQYLQSKTDGFYTVPGFESLYFWTGIAPATYLNVPERLLLNDEQQRRVIASLRKAKHPIIVINESAASVSDSAGPLGVLIHHQCFQVAQFGKFRVLEVASQAEAIR